MMVIYSSRVKMLINGVVSADATEGSVPRALPLVARGTAISILTDS